MFHHPAWAVGSYITVAATSRGNSPNLSQPNPGSPPDVSPCTLKHIQRRTQNTQKKPNQRCPPETGQVERDARPDRVGDLQPPEEAEGGGRGRQVIATADFVLLDDADFLVDVAAGGGKDSYGAALLL